MKNYLKFIIFTSFIKIVKPQGFDYDPKPDVFDFFVNSIIPLVIFLFLFSEFKGLMKKFIKVFDDALFLGIYGCLQFTLVEFSLTFECILCFTTMILPYILFRVFLYLKCFENFHSYSRKIIGIAYFFLMGVVP